VSEGTVRQWCRMLKDGRKNCHDEEWSCLPAVCNEWWSCSNVVQKIRERRRFTTSEILYEFRQISHTVLYNIITVRLGYHHKFCARWVPKILTGAHKMQRMASALTFKERYHKDGDEFVNNIVWVTSDETWVSFVNFFMQSKCNIFLIMTISNHNQEQANRCDLFHKFPMCFILMTFFFYQIFFSNYL
jgi:hypothetical protein